MLRRRRLYTGLALLIVAGLSALDHAGAFGYRGSSRERYRNRPFTIVYAADGDTIDIDVPDHGRPRTRIRMWGVDCPEIAHGPGEHDAYFGRQATDWVRAYAVGRTVRLEFDPTESPRDRYGRLLAYVYFVDGGTMLNEELIRLGLAYADRRFPHVFKQRFGELEREAVKQKAGLWAGVTPEQMPAWRQRMDARRAR